MRGLLESLLRVPVHSLKVQQGAEMQIYFKDYGTCRIEVHILQRGSVAFPKTTTRHSLRILSVNAERIRRVDSDCSYW